MNRPDMAAAAGDVADMFAEPTIESLANASCDDMVNALGLALLAADRE